VDSVADAIILVDNQRYVRKDFSLLNNIAKINALIAEPFYNLLCSGEEKKARHIGARLLDAGDIMQTVVGWTIIGYGQSSLPMIRSPFKRAWNFRNKSDETHKGIQAMDGALSELSLMCNPADAGRALYLLSAPAKEMNMDVVKALGDRIKDFAPKAVIRNGDYPRGGGVDVTVVLSELADVEKVRKYYSKSASLMREVPKKHEEAESKLSGMQDAAKDVPLL
jgi:cell division GTPase FtsZ